MLEMLSHGILPAPPASFCRRLRQYDDRLELAWDIRRKAWSILCREEDGSKTFVLAVVEPDGSAAPLDEHVFTILNRNRYYAQHPQELMRVVVDEPAERQAKAAQRTHENVGQLAKDPALRREWNKLRETVGSVSIAEWKTERPIFNLDGTPALYTNPVTGVEEPVVYKPHESWQGA